MAENSLGRKNSEFLSLNEVTLRSFIWGLSIVWLMCGAYLASWWDRVFPPMDGHDLFYHFAYRHGVLPHRDYFDVIQPGNYLWSVGVHALFGPSQWAYAMVNLLLRMAAVGCL